MSRRPAAGGWAFWLFSGIGAGIATGSPGISAGSLCFLTPLPDPVMSNQGFHPTYVTIFKVLPFTAFSKLGDWVSDLIILSNLLVWLVNSVNIRGVVTGVMKQFRVWLLA